jgi:fructokinase
MSEAQIVKISDQELRFLTGSDDPAAARRLWHDRLELLVVTLGPAGCVYLTPASEGTIAGFAVDAIDATGAGDGFVAGLLHGLLRDPAAARDPERLRAICRLACAVGALTTTERGAIPALPTAAQVQQFLNSDPTIC